MDRQKMPKSKIIISLFFLILSPYSLAMPDDRQQIAHLSANSADLNQSSHKGTYIGDVQFDQGTTHLRALKAITEGDQQNKLIFAVAFGDSVTPAHYWEQTALDKPLLHAYANEIRYYPERHLIELIGDARVVQGEDSFSAPKIRYNTLKKHVIGETDGKTRTVIIMHPEKKT